MSQTTQTTEEIKEPLSPLTNQTPNINIHTQTNSGTTTNTTQTPTPNTQTDTIQIDDYLETHFSLSEHVEIFLCLVEELGELLQKKDQSSLRPMFEKIFKMNKILKKDSTLADYSIKTFCSNHSCDKSNSLFLDNHFKSVSKSVFNLLSYSTGYSKGLDHFYVQIETVKEDIELNLLEAAEKISDFIELVEVVELELNKPKNNLNIPIKITYSDNNNNNNNNNNNHNNHNINNNESKKHTGIEIGKEAKEEEKFKDKNKNENEISKQKLQLDDQIIHKRRSISCDSKNTNNKQMETKYSSFHEFTISDQNYNLKTTSSKVSGRSHLEVQQNPKTNTQTKTEKGIETETETETGTEIENMNRNHKPNENSELAMKQIPYKPTKPLEYQKSFVKVYFHSTSFTTLPLNEDESVEKVIENLKKKKYIKNSEDYVFVEKIGKMERILDPQIKPFFLKLFWDLTNNGFCRFEYKPKSEVKNPMETNKKRLIRIFFLNNGYITLQVHHNTMCLDLIRKIKNKFRFKNLIDINKYSLYIKEDPVFCSFSTLSKKNLISSNNLNKYKNTNINMNNKNKNNGKNKNKNNNNKSKNKNKKKTKMGNKNNNNADETANGDTTLKNTKSNENNYSNLRLIEHDENIIECINSYELNSKKMIFIFKENQTHAPKRASVYWGKTTISLDKVNQLKKELGIERIQKQNKTRLKNVLNNTNLIKSFSFDSNYITQKNQNEKAISLKKNKSFLTASDNDVPSDVSDSEQVSIDMCNVEEGDETCSCFVWIDDNWVSKILSLQGSNLYYFDDFQTSQINYQIISLTNAQFIQKKKKQFQFQFQKRKYILIQTQLQEQFKISFSSQSNFNQWKKKIEEHMISLDKEQQEQQQQQNSQNKKLLSNNLHMKISTDKKEMQSKTFQNWLNYQITQNIHFNQICKKITNLQTDLQDGVMLLLALETITEEKINFNREPSLLLHRMKNLKKCFDSLRKKGIELGELSEEAIYDGNLHFILDLIWILIYQIKNKKNNKNQLLNWIKSQIYKVSDVTIQDFTSFKNPDLLLFLIHSLHPQDFPYPAQYLQLKTKEKFKIAFESAKKFLCIPKLISLNDILNDTIDERSMITYLYFFQNSLDY
ncbi:hypothetical protein M0812_12219 [Anaeramoeba flamelloides]|uniref:PH domain-containing protein n=1 Tax=Anaeramoeba flamelloides TaxID=1746091 RepID=A0AAV7ZLC2_9EUKA|nr:hypothetical protein M0812_12219 [Anaeramoeba flamelloides]